VTGRRPRGAAGRDYLRYPSADAILTELLPSYVRNAVYRGLVETAAAEQASRRTARPGPEDPERSSHDREQAHQRAQQRRLARTVRPHQGKRRARRDEQVDVGDQRHAPVAHRETARLEQALTRFNTALEEIARLADSLDVR
jgi:hypothetical protein